MNAITDVEGVLVGHVTRIEGESIRTGVTAIRPHGGNLFAEKVPGGVFVGNAFGKLAGSTQVQELGTIEAPIVLTNTLNVAEGLAGGIEWTLAQPGNERVRSVNVVVGETNDGALNDIRGRHVTMADVKAAIEGAAGGSVAEGNVGAGTGTVAFGWKGGMGTASRRLPAAAGGYTLGVLVQANYGGSLYLGGREYFQYLPPGGRRGGMAGKVKGGAGRPGERSSAGGTADALPDAPGMVAHAPGMVAHAPGTIPDAPGTADGSCMIVVATDAPLDGRSLERLAARAVFGLARTGSAYSNGSGDYAIAFSTARAVRVAHGQDVPASRTLLPADALSPLFEAALEATEEAVYNALLQAADMKGAGGREIRALPVAEVKAWIARQRGR
ncbi:MAG: P1 family peptidase [Vicinamibacteraceae bacterium]|nr:P1 family peptidase [Vicinamibacteraceae bacterium]